MSVITHQQLHVVEIVQEKTVTLLAAVIFLFFFGSSTMHS